METFRDFLWEIWVQIFVPLCRPDLSPPLGSLCLLLLHRLKLQICNWILCIYLTASCAGRCRTGGEKIWILDPVFENFTAFFLLMGWVGEDATGLFCTPYSIIHLMRVEIYRSTWGVDGTTYCKFSFRRYLPQTLWAPFANCKFDIILYQNG